MFDKHLVLPCDYQIVSEYRFDGNDYIEETLQSPLFELTIGKLMPAEFKIYLLNRV